MSTMVYSDYVKQRVIVFHNEGLKAPSIAKAHRAEGISVSRVGVHRELTSKRHGCLRDRETHLTVLKMENQT